MPLIEVRFGLSVALNRVEYDRFRLPVDHRDATLAELLPWFPGEIQEMPPWALMSIIPGMGGLAGFAGSSALVKTTTFLTITSAADQAWSVLADWNSADNALYVLSAGANGSGLTGCGGGGFAKAVNQTLTASGSSKYRLREGNAGSGTTNACWIGGASTTSLATSLCGIQCADSNGGSTTSAVGSTKFAGGNGGSGFSEEGGVDAGGGGGGAAGPSGAGGNGGNASDGSSGNGGTGDNGTVAAPGVGSAGLSGTEFDASHGCGSGGGGHGGGGTSSDGGLYGGGGGGNTLGGGVGKQGLIATVNNASL